MTNVRENVRSTWPGIPVLLLLLTVALGCVAGFIGAGVTGKDPLWAVVSIVVGIVDVFLLAGLFAVNPNEAKVLQLFGRYVGTVREPGLRWANPFLSKKAVSVRARNFETERLKVNDLDGNPVEIGAIVVWRVVDTAEAVFGVDDYENYMKVQSESALRSLASRYPYDAHDDERVSLRGSMSEVTERLKSEIQERLAQAGVEVGEARIAHLAYAPEIAAAMLRRQQAAAVIAARKLIVEGAVGMVEMALELLSQKKVVDFDEERKAAMVSNLLVVLCAEQEVQPVVNTGTLHH